MAKVPTPGANSILPTVIGPSLPSSEWENGTICTSGKGRWNEELIFPIEPNRDRRRGGLSV